MLEVTVIDSFRGDYEFLSNFYPCLISHDGLEYKNLEAAFQAAKCTSLNDRIKFTNLDAGEAKKIGRNVILRRDWETVKYFVMTELLVIKFAFNPRLMRSLRATGSAMLIEGNSWHDNYWGNCTCPKCEAVPGYNHLGKLLMVLRDNTKITQPQRQLQYRTVKRA